jgi:hypothetical protein
MGREGFTPVLTVQEELEPIIHCLRELQAAMVFWEVEFDRN